MKVYRDGKEVKGAKVFYGATGVPAHVEVDGQNLDPSVFEFKEAEKKNTRTTEVNEEIMTTADTNKRSLKDRIRRK